MRKRTYLLTISLTVFVSTGAALGPARPSLAQAGCAEGALCLDSGIACSFGLQIEFNGGEHRVSREFTDKNGNPVRFLNAGKGYALTFTNLDTGATLALQANGSILHTTYNADGSRTEVATGHNVIILFPTDTPAGPSTVQYVGRVVYRVDPGEVFTLQEVRGKSTDICAALSQ